MTQTIQRREFISMTAASLTAALASAAPPAPMKTAQPSLPPLPDILARSRVLRHVLHCLALAYAASVEVMDSGEADADEYRYWAFDDVYCGVTIIFLLFGINEPYDLRTPDLSGIAPHWRNVGVRQEWVAAVLNYASELFDSLDASEDERLRGIAMQIQLMDSSVEGYAFRESHEPYREILDPILQGVL